VIPPQANAECVCAMENVLEVYTRPYDSRRPQVCVDETSTQLVAETRLPIPPAPGQPERINDLYERQGTANLCMVFEPLAGQRRVKVTEQRTSVDFAHLIRAVVDKPYPQAEKIVLVMDHLNTHPPRPADGWNVWRFITHPRMAVGWIGLRPNSGSWRGNVWTGGFPTPQP
jgi:hypothetical protein